MVRKALGVSLTFARRGFPRGASHLSLHYKTYIYIYQVSFFLQSIVPSTAFPQSVIDLQAYVRLSILSVVSTYLAACTGSSHPEPSPVFTFFFPVVVVVLIVVLFFPNQPGEGDAEKTGKGSAPSSGPGVAAAAAGDGGGGGDGGRAGENKNKRPKGGKRGKGKHLSPIAPEAEDGDASGEAINPWRRALFEEEAKAAAKTTGEEGGGGRQSDDPAAEQAEAFFGKGAAMEGGARAALEAEALVLRALVPPR